MFELNKEWRSIGVKIAALSLTLVLESGCAVFWRLTSNDEWQTVLMKNEDAPESFVATIPGAAPGQIVEYYLSAADQSGRREFLPRSAPDGFYSFTVQRITGE